MSVPKSSESISNTFAVVELDKPEEKTEDIPVRVRSIKSEKKIVNINLTFIKQTLKSRLTICQLILLLLNILGIITVVIIVVVVRKQSCSTQKSSDGKYIN